MKKKLILLSTAALLVAISIVGGSLAATSAVGQKATNDLAAPTLAVSIDSSAAAELTLDSTSAMPGDELAASFTIENTADVPLYARVTVTKYWADETSQKNNETKDAALIGMSADSAQWLQAEDILTGTSGETEVYYYALPLQPGQAADLDLTLLLDLSLGNEYRDASVMLDASVDAVQYVAGENELNASGILATFGVAATLNGDGSIQSVAQ